MISFQQFVGIDISKKTFDVALIKDSAVNVEHHFFPQTKEGFTAFSQWLKKHDTDLSKVLVCMEHTGVYTQGIIDCLVAAKVNLWVEMAIKIKRSMGLQRGGNDKTSAIIIAEYAMRFTDRARLWKLADTALLGLRNLITQRDRIIKAQNQLLVPVEELRSCGLEREAKSLCRLQRPAITGLEKAKQQIDEAINNYIKANEHINKTINLMCSIKGIGRETAVNLYAYTKGFTMFENVKQLACYCGVVPFAKSSGTSVHFKPSVSPFANRKLKSLLHLCAMSALQGNQDLKKYYERKVAEGKNKMSVINAIRNKLLQRIFAVVRDGRPYVENYVYGCK